MTNYKKKYHKYKRLLDKIIGGSKPEDRSDLINTLMREEEQRKIAEERNRKIQRDLAEQGVPAHLKSGFADPDLWERDDYLDSDLEEDTTPKQICEEYKVSIGDRYKEESQTILKHYQDLEKYTSFVQDRLINIDWALSELERIIYAFEPSLLSVLSSFSTIKNLLMTNILRFDVLFSSDTNYYWCEYLNRLQEMEKSCNESKSEVYDFKPPVIHRTPFLVDDWRHFSDISYVSRRSINDMVTVMDKLQSYWFYHMEDKSMELPDSENGLVAQYTPEQQERLSVDSDGMPQETWNALENWDLEKTKPSSRDSPWEKNNKLQVVVGYFFYWFQRVQVDIVEIKKTFKICVATGSRLLDHSRSLRHNLQEIERTCLLNVPSGKIQIKVNTSLGDWINLIVDRKKTTVGMLKQSIIEQGFSPPLKLFYKQQVMEDDKNIREYRIGKGKKKKKFAAMMEGVGVGQPKSNSEGDKVSIPVVDCHIEGT